MPAPFLSSFSDIIDYLSTQSGSGATTPEQRDVRQACYRAYQKIGTAEDWAFYKRAYRVLLQEPYDTGTVAFDFTGGTYERQLTLSGGTWPAWAAYGKVLIGDVLHEVEARKSNSVITLAEANNPLQDVSSTSYTLIRTSYDMPGDYRGSWEPIDENRQSRCYVSPSEWQAMERIWPDMTTAFNWTVLPSENSYATWSLRTHGYPSELETLDFLYQGRPRPIKYTGYETNSRAGTVTITGGTTTVTGTSTQFTAAMIGSLLRVSSDTAQYPTGIADLNPWSEQKVITAVASTTSLTVDSAFASSYSATKYIVADPIDVDEDLYELLVAAAEMEFARIRKSDRIGVASQIYEKTLRRCLETNSKRRGHLQAQGHIFMPWTGTDSSDRAVHPEPYA